MLDDTPTDADFNSGQPAQPDPGQPDSAAADAPDSKPRRTRKQAATGAEKPAKKAAAKKTAAKKTAAKKSAAPAASEPAVESAGETAAERPAKKAGSRRSAAKKSADASTEPAAETTAGSGAEPAGDTGDAAEKPKAKRTRKKAAAAPAETDEGSGPGAVPLFQVPETPAPQRRRRSAKATAAEQVAEPAAESAAAEPDETGVEARDGAADDGSDESATGRRRRRRGGRRRRKSGDGPDAEAEAGAEATDAGDSEAGDTDGSDDAAEGTSRRRRRRRRSGEEGDGSGGDDPAKTVTRVRKGRSAEDEITAVSGSTRLEAKKQRRREGREAGRRRAPIVSEAEFLARREAVERVMVVRQREELTQIGVLEDKVLVEHYVARESQTSLIGNVYLGRVQNVLPSMEAAFVDIGKGRNAVLYAGEVNWSSLGHQDGQPRKIEAVLSSGQQILVQVTKDPIGHKGARLTSQVSLAGRFLVYVPDGTTSGISRKLPDTERNRLKTLLKEIVPDTAGVIVRTAAEGASEDELTRDVERLKARWEDIEKKAATKGANAQLLYGEPDLTLKVVRDLFTEDFTRLVIEGDEAWETVQGYVAHVAPDLQERLERYRPEDHGGRDVFAAHRLDEQIHKGLDRKVWLPSGGSLIIDRTEAMTVVDVNTGKFTGSGGNLEETVTKNNLEAAEEIVRQLRLRDIGGIIVVDFIDMVLESNRDLVLRRLVECLGRDRTRHQVAEVTSLGLVQMTRKRIGTGLLESFSRECEHCHGRGLLVEDAPIEARRADDDGGRRGRRRGRGSEQQPAAKTNGPPSPKDVAAMAQHHAHHDQADDELPDDELPDDEQPDDEVVVDLGEDVTVVESVEVMEAVQAEETSAVDGVLVAEIVDETPDEAPDEAPPAPPEPPKVVTRTRRRAATRPAGPPAGLPSGEAAAVSGSVLVDDARPGEAADHDHHDAGPALHVPIKRRGRKR